MRTTAVVARRQWRAPRYPRNTGTSSETTSRRLIARREETVTIQTGDPGVEQRVAAFQERFGRLQEQIHRVIVGQDDVVERVLMAVSREAMSFSRASQASQDHAHQDAVPGTRPLPSRASSSRRISCQPISPARTSWSTWRMVGEVSVPARLGVCASRPGGRDQSCHAQDPVGPPGGHAGAERDGGRRGAPPPRALFVMATQNPIDMEGTYPLPEAQVDRFLFKLTVGFPSSDELVSILERTTTSTRLEVEMVADGAAILEMRRLSQEVLMATAVAQAIASLVVATHPNRPEAPQCVRSYVRYGSSPRGAQAMARAARVRRCAMAASTSPGRRPRRGCARDPASPHPELRAEAEGVTQDAVVEDLLAGAKRG